MPARPVQPVNVPPAVPLPANPGGDSDVARAVFDRYPAFAYLLAIPEVRDLLIEAVTPGSEFSPEAFAAKLYATDWWRTTQASVRQWDARFGQDPASAQADVRGRVAEIRDIAGQAGLALSTQQALQFAEQTLRFGIATSSAEFRDGLALLIPGFSGDAQGNLNRAPAGQFGLVYAQVKKLARDYLMPLSDRDAYDLARKAFAGDVSLEGLAVTWGHHARTRSPALAQAIDAGQTPAEYFAPIRGAVASELEISADTIDLFDPQWSQLLGVEDGKGGTRLMSIGEAQLFARSRPEWRKTRRANDEESNLTRTLLREMGAIA